MPIRIDQYSPPQRFLRTISETCAALVEDVVKQTGTNRRVACLLVANYLISVGEQAKEGAYALEDVPPKILVN